MNRFVPIFIFSLVLTTAHAAEEWAALATISATEVHRTCFTDDNGTDVTCPDYAPYISNTGFVGIGTTAPSHTLTISGTTWTKALELEAVTGAAVPVSISVEAYTETDPQVGTLGASGQYCTTDGSTINCSTDAPTGDDLGNHTASQTLSMAGYDIDNVGHISATTVSATYFEGDGSLLTNLPAATADSIVSGTSSVSVSENASITFTTSATQRMVIGANGKVGIGTTDPRAELEVSGTISATTVSATAFYGDGSNLTGVGGSIDALDDIGDVNAGSPADGVALVWDDTTSKWIPGPVLQGCSYSALTPAMTSNSTTGITVSASSQYDPSFAPWKAFDESSGAWVTSNGTTSGILTVQFSSVQLVNKYSIKTRNDSGYGDDQAPKSWTFEGSNNGSSWTILDTQSNITSWTADDEVKEFTLASASSYTYYRLNITENVGTSGYTSFTGVGEFELFAQSCSGADDLGSHIAEQDLAMAGYDIDNVGHISATTVSATYFEGDGSLLTNLPAATADSIVSGTSSVSVSEDTSITFFTDATQRVVIGTDGKVGIGTTAPATLLDVSSTLYVTNAGTVGIGTSTPGAGLEISGTNQTIQLTAPHSTKNWMVATAGLGDVWRLGTLDSNPEVRLEASYATGQLKFMTGGANERMRINASGKVGIGTTDPRAELEVSGTISATVVSATAFYGDGSNLTGVGGSISALNDIGDVSATAPTDGQILTWNDSDSEWQAADTATATPDSIVSGTSSVSVSEDTSITFFTDATQRMVIGTDGKVGIGTENPNTSLEIGDNTTGGPEFIRLNTLSSSATQVVFRRGATQSFFGPTSNGKFDLGISEAIPFTLNLAGTERLRVAPSGDMGIGTTDPQTELEVSGSISATTVQVSGGTGTTCDSSTRGTLILNASGRMLLCKP